MVVISLVFVPNTFKNDFISIFYLLYQQLKVFFYRYVAGQLDQIADEVYDTRLRIRVLQEENTSAVSAQLMASAAAKAAGPQNVLVKYRLDFDNSAYVGQHAAVQTFDRLQLPSIPVAVLLRLFPFGVVIGRDIRIMDAGEKLLSVWGAATADDVRGHLLVEHFVLRRPRDIPFTWTNVSVYYVFFFLGR